MGKYLGESRGGLKEKKKILFLENKLQSSPAGIGTCEK